MSSEDEQKDDDSSPVDWKTKDKGEGVFSDDDDDEALDGWDVNFELKEEDTVEKSDEEEKEDEKQPNDEYEKFFKDPVVEERSHSTLEQVIQTSKSESTPLVNNKELWVTIGDPQYNSGGLFGFSYNDFQIVSEPFEWIVRWRESDFVKLRDYYQKMFPQYVVPPLI